ncbi:lycopene beta-cyclase CrtY [Acuticoccus sp. I52.16.1]|uniref:lycopene beta-cyclase CrtY n=1 Tax=Acuticoccus sp. I52.16.1 TaxID=2928472 RepID=UPI001FD2C4CC|nr:lycopene beta-cyclase CrtY [Acuticoccus sp. I52.16.1]UOM33415.1 lycopene beta-cyclase CrtY [Acuticoccus sp. I52.16.1]
MVQRLIIAGGGLSGVLAAMAFAERGDVAVTLLEAADRLGGAHTWSFYASDLDAAATRLVGPLVAHRWSGYDVRFAGLARALTTPYRTITAASLDRAARERLGERVLLEAPVAALDAAGATLADGTRLPADAVLDARGPTGLAGLALAYQSFVGQEVALAAPHGLRQPTIMDATVDQLGGYRFVYLLPYSPTTLLVEDTYYTETPVLDRDTVAARIAAYAETRGWRIAEVRGEERGALPLVLSGDGAAMWAAAAPAGGAVPIGLRAGLFHPVTSYSLPLAARTAVALSRLAGPLTTQRLRGEVQALVRRHFAATSFERLLNRMLFLAGPPQDRHRILERFHRLPQPLIERFYAGRLRRADQARILMGRPPVPIGGALRAIRARPAAGVSVPRP